MFNQLYFYAEKTSDPDLMMKILVVQQFQQQSNLWQTALLQLLTRPQRPKPAAVPKASSVARFDKGKKLRILGYIEIFAYLIRQRITNKFFSISGEQQFSITLKMILKTAEAYLLQGNNTLLSKLKLLASGERYQLECLERGGKANLIKDAIEIVQCAFERIYLTIVS
ncbi:unnamed protein product [Echinostoma caproni]|uniref:Four helix bundle protein n=1 Tax=Echinostoma caproni TaxID=27848 RepID=A0A183AN34_9TREM|nr:unnamed protein product [Echinostoma caproni]